MNPLESHPYIPQEILYDEPTGRLALVFELMDMHPACTMLGGFRASSWRASGCGALALGVASVKGCRSFGMRAQGLGSGALSSRLRVRCRQQSGKRA